MSLSSDDPHFVQRESWAAFLNPFVWALGHCMWKWAVLTLIPGVNAYVWIRLWLGGRTLSWQSSDWSIESFKQRERRLLWLNGVLFVLIVGLQVLMLSLSSLSV